MDLTKLFEYGVLGAILSVLCIFIWRTLVFIAPKLFDDKTGYISRFVDAHIDFVERTSENLENQTKILDNMNSEIKGIKELHNKQIAILERAFNNIDHIDNHKTRG